MWTCFIDYEKAFDGIEQERGRGDRARSPRRDEAEGRKEEEEGQEEEIKREKVRRRADSRKDRKEEKCPR